MTQTTTGNPEPKFVLFSEEIRWIGDVNKMYILINQDLEENNVENLRAHTLELNNLILNTIVNERGNSRPVTDDELKDLNSAYKNYLRPIDEGNQSGAVLQDNLLSAIDRFVHAGQDIEPISLGQLIEKIEQREKIISTLDKKNRRASYRLMAICLLFLLTGTTAASFYQQKKSARAELAEKIDVINAKDNEITRLQQAASSVATGVEQRFPGEIQILRGESDALKRAVFVSQGIVDGKNMMIQRLKRENEGQENRINELIDAAEDLKDELSDKDKEITRLQGEISGALTNNEQMALELIERIRKGEALTDSEIDFLRMVSNQNIEQWRANAAAEIVLIRASGQRDAETKVSIIQRAVDMKVASENQTVETLIVRARNARR